MRRGRDDPIGNARSAIRTVDTRAAARDSVPSAPPAWGSGTVETPAATAGVPTGTLVGRKAAAYP